MVAHCIFLFSWLFAVASASQNFSYDEKNEWGYSFPNTNWSHVPCKTGMEGKESCSALTGTLRTVCVKNSNATFMCVCTVLHGMKTPGCNLDQIAPRCVTGLNACTERTGRSYVFLVHGAVNSGITLLVFVMALQGFAHSLSNHGTTCNAKITTYIFVLVSCLLLPTYYIIIARSFQGDGSVEITISLYQIYGASIGIFCMMLLASVFNCAAVWVNVVTALKAMRATKSKNIGKREGMILTISGMSINIFMFLALLQNYTKLAGIIVVFASFILSIYCFLAEGASMKR